MSKFGLRSTGTNQYFYSEGDSGQSAASGVETSTGHYRIVLSSTPGADPTGTNAVLDFNTAANGNLNITPNGSGSVVISNTTIQGGTIDNTSVGATTASTVNATSYSLNGNPVEMLPQIAMNVTFSSASNVTGDSTTYQLLIASGFTTGCSFDGSGNITVNSSGYYLFQGYLQLDGLDATNTNLTFTLLSVATATNVLYASSTLAYAASTNFGFSFAQAIPIIQGNNTYFTINVGGAGKNVSINSASSVQMFALGTYS